LLTPPRQPRGAPENVGKELKAVHPVVRTNPVTGWKSIFPVGGHVKHVNGLTDEESTKLLAWFLDLVYKNHDLQVRLKWKSPNDIGTESKPLVKPSLRCRVLTRCEQRSGTTAVSSTLLRTTMMVKASASATGPLGWARGPTLIP
jgi:hypothetical protein